METQLGGIFSQMVSRYGLVIALVTIGIFGAFILGFIFLKARIEIMRQESAADLQRKAQEHNALVGELAQSRLAMQKLMSDVVAQGQEDRGSQTTLLAELSKSQGEQVLTLRAIANTLNAHTAQMGSRFSQVFKKLEDMHLSIVARTPIARTPNEQ